MSRKSTTRSSVKNPPAADVASLRVLADTEIDYSDIPATDAAFWAGAEVSPPATKSMISIRVDRVVLEWYRRHARYQSLMNAVLRTYKEVRELEQAPPKKTGR